MMTTLNLMKGDAPVRANDALVIEPAQSWQRLQRAHEFFFEGLDQQMKDHHRQSLELLMGYEHQCFLNAQPCQRTEARVGQANGFYRRHLTTRLGGIRQQRSTAAVKTSRECAEIPLHSSGCGRGASADRSEHSPGKH
jgi:hypothetical protein